MKIQACLLAVMTFLLSSHMASSSSLEELIADLNHELHIASMKYMDGFYERKLQQKNENMNIVSSPEETFGEHSRKRRSAAVLDMVKSARKTGNREELSFRSSIPFKSLTMFFQPEDIVPILIEEHIGNAYEAEKPLLFAVANNKNAQGGYMSSVMILSYNDTQQEFSLIQELPEYAPYEIESFSGKVSPTAHRHFLAVAGYATDNREANKMTMVSIYEITSSPNYQFRLIQRLQERNVRALKYVEISQSTFLLMGTFYQEMASADAKYSSPSQITILRYEPMSNYFHTHSTLPGSGVVDFECFKAGKKTYLTVANYCDDYGSLDIFSYVYLYRDDIRSFELIQYISTHGARDIEHFMLTNEHYLVIANEGSGTLSDVVKNAPSDVYKLVHGKFELIQKLETYGALKWKNIPVPNCKQDVLLVYADQRDNIDQVGIFSFSHNAETFSAVPFSIYHLDNVNGTSFRPNPLTLASFYTQDQISGEFNLYVILGVNNTAEGSTVYKLSYDVILTDSPFDAFTRNVEDQLKKLNDSINEVNDLLTNAENNLYDAVTITGNDVITGHKRFLNHLETEEANMTTLNMTEGSIFFLEKGIFTRKSEKYGPEVNIVNLQDGMLDSTTTINEVLTGKDTVMLMDEDQVATGRFQFAHVEANNGMKINGNLTVNSGIINDVIIDQFNNIILKNEDQKIKGHKTFASNVVIQNNITVGGLVNGMNFTHDLLLNNTDQTIQGSKSFKEGLTALNNITSDQVNGIAISDLAYINEDTTFSEELAFSKGIIAEVASFRGKLNQINVTDMLADTAYKSKQNSPVTGHKNFYGNVYSHSGVSVNTKVNGFDLNQLKSRVDALANDAVLRGEYVFVSDVTIVKELNISGSLNEIVFPNNVFLKSTNQQIPGNVSFYESVTFSEDVDIRKQVDGIDFSKLVLLSRDQNITGGKTFAQNVLANKIHMKSGKTVNGVDISDFNEEIMTLDSDETLDNMHLAEDTIVKSIGLNGSFRRKPRSWYETTYLNSLHLRGEQSITGNITMIGPVHVRNNVNSNLTNQASFPKDFATIDQRQEFSGPVVFSQDLTFGDVILENDIVRGINITSFNSDIIKPEIQSTISGNKTIKGPFTIQGELFASKKINSIDFDNDLFSSTSKQNISGIKHFEWCSIKGRVTAHKDVNVHHLIDGVDLSELDLSGMTISKNETITGNICFTKPNYNTSVQYINGIDLSELKKDIVTTNTEQVIDSTKSFNVINLLKSLNTSSLVDGFDVSEWADTLLHQQREAFISGTTVFDGNVVVEQNIHVEHINEKNVSTIYEKIISKSGNESIEDLHVTNVDVQNVDIETVNEFNFNDDFLFVSGEQNITGHKHIMSVTSDEMDINGLFNELNFTEFVGRLVFQDQASIVSAVKSFEKDVIIHGYISSGVINGLDLESLNWLKTENSDYQSVTGTKTFGDDVTINNIRIKHINGINMQEFVNNVAKQEETLLISGNVQFLDDVTTESHTIVDGNADVTSGINGINITKLDKMSLKTSEDQMISGKTFKGKVSFTNLQVVGDVNGLKPGKDLMTKHTTQTMIGRKRFHSLYFTDDILLDFINDVNITIIEKDSLLKNAPSIQTLRGYLNFMGGVSLQAMNTNGRQVDGQEIRNGVYVTLDTDQEITGHFGFSTNMHCDNLTVGGLVSGVNISRVRDEAIRKHDDATIAGTVVFDGDVHAKENVLITQLVNGIDVSTYSKSSPTIDQPYLDSLDESLHEKFQAQCNSLTYIKSSLSSVGYYFDYLDVHQTVHSGHDIHVNYFNFLGHYFLSVVSKNEDTNTSCTTTSLFKFNESSKYFELYQVLPTTAVIKVEFIDTVQEVFVVLLNKEALCNAKTGSVDLYKWNTGTSKFEQSKTFSSPGGVGDFVVSKEADVYYIFVTSPQSVIVIVNFGLGWTQVARDVSPWKRAHLFYIEDQRTVAGIYNTAADSSAGNIKIFSSQIINLDLVQTINMPAPSHVTTYHYRNDTFMFISNEHVFSADERSTYESTLEVYKYSKGDMKFLWFQSIPTYKGCHVTPFELGEHFFILITERGLKMKIYQNKLDLGFIYSEELNIDGVTGSHSLQVDGNHYIVAYNEKTEDGDADSLMYKIRTTGVNPVRTNTINDCK